MNELIRTVWTSFTRSNFQLNALAGSGPQAGSVPSPLNEITSPATTPVAAFGSRMVAVGVVPAVTPHCDVSFATVTVMGAESVGLPAASRNSRSESMCSIRYGSGVPRQHVRCGRVLPGHG